MYKLTVENLYKRCADNEVLKGVSLQARAGDVISLIGSSGSGKSTLLRCINLLENPNTGRIVLAGEELQLKADRHGELRAVNAAQLQRLRTKLAMVFQHFNLWAHMTVLQNIIEAPVNVLGIPKDKAVETARRYLERVGLRGVEDRYPSHMSGGQQQRVAIARALAVNPSLLLLDEPLSALDARVRADLRHELREVQRRLGIPTIMVTHDQEEALAMADRIVCMQGGRIAQAGSPRELYLAPRTRFVANFMGHSNLLPPAQARLLQPALGGAPEGMAPESALLCIRPERLQLQASAQGAGRVTGTTFLGSIQRVQLRWNDLDLLAESSSASTWEAGQNVDIAVSAQDCAWVHA